MNGKEFAIFINEIIGNVNAVFEALQTNITPSFDGSEEYFHNKWNRDVQKQLKQDKGNIDYYIEKCLLKHSKYYSLMQQKNLPAVIYINYWIKYINAFAEYIYYIYIILSKNGNENFTDSYNDFNEEIKVINNKVIELIKNFTKQNSDI